MLSFLYQITQSPIFYFATGILLLVLFFWYMASENDKMKRNAGSFFIVGLASFSIMSLFVNGMHYGIDIRGGVELTLEVQPKLDDQTGMPTPPTEEDMQQACNILEERLNSTGTSEVQIIHTNNKILIQIPQQDTKDEKANKEKLDAMVNMLTRMAKLELLAVHPDSERLIAQMMSIDSATGKPLVDFETYINNRNACLAAQKAGDNTKRMPTLRIPAKLGLNDYQILPSPVVDDETGEPVTDANGNQQLRFFVLQIAATLPSAAICTLSSGKSKLSAPRRLRLFSNTPCKAAKGRSSGSSSRSAGESRRLSPSKRAFTPS